MDSPTSNIRWARLSFHQWSKVEKIKKLFLGYCFGVLLFVLLNNHVEISCCYSLSRGFSLGIDFAKFHHELDTSKYFLQKQLPM